MIFTTRSMLVAAAAIACTLPLAGCINSAAPILTDSQQMFGPQATFQLYSLRNGLATSPEQVTFAWDGKAYVRKSGGLKDVQAFSAHPFEGGDTIIQSIPAKKTGMVEYAVMHELTKGVYQIAVIDEDDADQAARTAGCKHPGGVACRIETREQLFTFARATAAKKNGSLAVRLGDAERR